MSELTQKSNGLEGYPDGSSGIRRLTRTQAVNQAVNIGRYPKRIVDEFECDVPRLRKHQTDVAFLLASRIKAGNTTLIIGPPGVGKTFIACIYGFAWYERGYFRQRGKALYYTQAGLFRMIKDGFGKNEETHLQRAGRCGLLVLDEITAQNDSVFDQRELRDLIDTRHRNKLATILISNLSLDQLSAAFDLATIDRLFEGGRGIIELNGQSQRN